MDNYQVRFSRLQKKTRDGLKSITVEPILFFFVFGSALIYPCIKDLVYVKVCLNKFNHTICDDLSNENYTQYEDAVQAEASIWYLRENLCFEIPSILIAFFYGALSDHVSRKLALLLPAVGQVLSSINYVINAAFFQLPVGFILIGPLISGLFGGWITCCMACFSYLSDISSKEWRTIRIAIGESMISASVAISLFSGGAILDHTSFVFVLTMALVMYVIVILYTFFRINELPVAEGRERPTGCCKSFLCAFNPRRIKEALAVVCKKREYHRRRHIILILVCTLLSVLSITPSESLGYLYLKRHPLGWSQSLYGYFQGYRTTIRGLFVIIVVPLLIRKAKVREALIVAIAFASSALAEVVFGLSKTTWLIFLVPLVGMMGDAQWTCIRSLLSQAVEPHEYGQIFAVFGSLQSASILLGTTIYNNLYPATLHFWVGFCFVVGASVAIIPISLMIYVNHDMKRQGVYERMEEDHTEPGIDVSVVSKREDTSTTDGNKDTSQLTGTVQFEQHGECFT